MKTTMKILTLVSSSLCRSPVSPTRARARRAAAR